MEHNYNSEKIKYSASEFTTNSINLLGVKISAVCMDDAIGMVMMAISNNHRGIVCLRDVHGVVKSQKNYELKSIHNSSFLVTPDGMPIVWALKICGYNNSGRVYGPDLMLELFDKGRSQKICHFLYGSTLENLDLLESNLLKLYPGAKIVGKISPPFRDIEGVEDISYIDQINRSNADIVWVGLGTPKQELWMGRNRDRLAAPMLIGVGAAFDFHAGMKPQAPKFIQRSGFEWLFRLATEPRRLGMRYLFSIPIFILFLIMQITGIKKFNL